MPRAQNQWSRLWGKPKDGGGQRPVPSTEQSCKGNLQRVQDFVIFLQQISFLKDLKFLSYKSFPCSSRVTPRCFILCEAIVNAVVSLISFSMNLPFVYRRAFFTDFFF